MDYEITNKRTDIAKYSDHKIIIRLSIKASAGNILVLIGYNISMSLLQDAQSFKFQKINCNMPDPTTSYNHIEIKYRVNFHNKY